jgi:hypothetical protein
VTVEFAFLRQILLVLGVIVAVSGAPGTPRTVRMSGSSDAEHPSFANVITSIQQTALSSKP